MAVYETGSRAETAALGERLAKVLRSGSLVLFTGGLGAGKTAFCEGIARGLGCTDEVSSPTFAIVNVYRGPQPFAHFDMYRISTMEDLQATGFFDYLDDGAVVAAEWSENVAPLVAGEPLFMWTSQCWTSTAAASPSRGLSFDDLWPGFCGKDRRHCHTATAG
ncbi:MAG: tRNA (adenosine(37)-N6)-threonylcarbamoyltransferase complex ATPase subunit type 1 TsaE [Ruthenibacterium lactatiformans]